MPNEIATMRRTLAPTTFAEAFDFAAQLAKSSMVPAEYRGKPENILLAIQWGQELGIAPLQAIQNIAVINGKPSVYGDTLLALVRGSPVCDDVIETFEGAGDDLTAICEARRKGKSPVTARFSVADAKAAGLWSKQGPWKQYPRRMLQMRARGFALRDAFPDVLRGVITVEEAADYPVNVHTGKAAAPIDLTPKRDLDQFAAAGEIIDAETGEVTDVHDDSPAMLAAKDGTEAFRAFWRGLSSDDRHMLRAHLGEYQRIAETADREHENEDPFGLPPLNGSATASPAGNPQPEPQERATEAAGSGPLNHSDQAPAGGPTRDLLGDQPAEDVFVPYDAADPAFFARQVLAMHFERPDDRARNERIAKINAGNLTRLRQALPSKHDEVRRALDGRGSPDA